MSRLYNKCCMHDIAFRQFYTEQKLHCNKSNLKLTPIKLPAPLFPAFGLPTNSLPKKSLYLSLKAKFIAWLGKYRYTLARFPLQNEASPWSLYTRTIQSMGFLYFTRRLVLMDWVWMSSFTRSAGAPAICVVMMRCGQWMKGLGFTESEVADSIAGFICWSKVLTDRLRNDAGHTTRNQISYKAISDRNGGRRVYRHTRAMSTLTEICGW